MKADRLDYYRNQLRGVAVADLGRAAWAAFEYVECNWSRAA